MRAAVALVIAAAFVGTAVCGGEGAVAKTTALRIDVFAHDVYRPQVGPPDARFTLRCSPVGGRHPQPVEACAAIASSDEPLRQGTEGTICYQKVYGNATAIVTGRVRGRRVWMRFHLRDSCGADRWRTWGVVVPGGPNAP